MTRRGEGTKGTREDRVAVSSNPSRLSISFVSLLVLRLRRRRPLASSSSLLSLPLVSMNSIVYCAILFRCVSLFLLSSGAALRPRLTPVGRSQVIIKRLVPETL